MLGIFELRGLRFDYWLIPFLPKFLLLITFDFLRNSKIPNTDALWVGEGFPFLCSDCFFDENIRDKSSFRLHLSPGKNDHIRVQNGRFSRNSRTFWHLSHLFRGKVVDVSSLLFLEFYGASADSLE